MEEAHQIVLQALEQAGVTLPAGAESVEDLSSPAVVVAVCSRALLLVQGASPLSPPPSFPSSMSDRIRLCTEIASSIKHLGFKGDLSFHQFLYPSEEETYKLFRFLLDKISNVADTASGNGSDLGQEKNCTPPSSNGLADIKEGDLSRLEEQLNALYLENSKLKSLEVENEKDTLFMESQKRLVDSRTDLEFILAKLESEKSLLESSAFTRDEELHLKLQEVENVQQKIEKTKANLQQRDHQNEALSREVDKSSKGPSRTSYVRQITELIKNSKKQDADIARIIGETRELQRKSNENQGRLKRTYALVDELVFREAKKDAACRQAYRLLTSMHENFAECYDKVFTLDKLHKEIGELQATLEAMEKSPVDFKRAEADFNALVSENLSLEKILQGNKIKVDLL